MMPWVFMSIPSATKIYCLASWTHFEPFLSFLWKLGLAAFKIASADHFRAKKSLLILFSTSSLLDRKNQALSFSFL